MKRRKIFKVFSLLTNCNFLFMSSIVHPIRRSKGVHIYSVTLSCILLFFLINCTAVSAITMIIIIVKRNNYINIY